MTVCLNKAHIPNPVSHSFSETAYTISAASEETVVDHINRHVLKLKITIDESVEVNFSIVIAVHRNAVYHLTLDDEFDENRS